MKNLPLGIQTFSRMINEGYLYIDKTRDIHRLFAEGRFRNYWFSTGTPTFLTRLIRQQSAMVSDFEYLLVNSLMFDFADFEQPDLAHLLFQNGFLSIKSRKEHTSGELLVLSFPNQEACHAFDIGSLYSPEARNISEYQYEDIGD